MRSINKIATPVNVISDKASALYHNHTSSYYVYALIASLFGLATSTIAPACLSVNRFTIDGDIYALEVGGLRHGDLWPRCVISAWSGQIYNALNSFHRGSFGNVPQPSDQATLNYGNLGSFAWSELALNSSFSYTLPISPENGTYYLIPLPLSLSSTTKARWISDIISIQPSCEWIAPTPSVLQNPLNGSSPNFNYNISDRRLPDTNASDTVVLIDTIDSSKLSLRHFN